MIIAFLVALSLFGLIVFAAWRLVKEKTVENEQAEKEADKTDY